MYAIRSYYGVIQRNVRMVLILVDGQSTVGDLCRKTGNPQLTENALAELEKGGFITAKVEQHDSLWQESRITSYNVCYTKLLRSMPSLTEWDPG